jgi:nucleoside-diphosphate-sugar epimerase
MKILINGSSGFIGANLIKHFVDKSNAYNPFEIWAINKRDIDPIIKEFFKVEEVKQLRDFANLPKNYFDFIFNSSGPSQPSIFISNPKLVFESNIYEIPGLLSALKEDGKFFQFSSSEIYSGCVNLPCSESHRGALESSNPRLSYVLSKELSERILETYRGADQKICILRLSLVFGPGVLWDDTRFLSDMIKKGLAGDIEITANANIRRYLFIDDFINMVESLLDYESPFSIFNIGGLEEYNLVDIANLVGNKLHRNVVIKESSTSSGAPMNVSVSMNKFLSEVKNIAFTDFEVGLDKTIEWFRILENRTKS